MFEANRFNEQVSKILKIEEGFSKVPYLCSEGVPTIGIGKKIGPKNADIKQYQFNIDLTIAEHWLALELKHFTSEIHTNNFELLCSALHECNAPRRAILMSMIYQMGLNGVSQFKNTLQAISIRNFELAAIEMLDSLWANQTPQRAERHSEQIKTGLWHDYYGVKSISELIKHNDNFFVLDTETTGLYDYDQVIELGLIDQSGAMYFNDLIKTDVDINPEAQAIHGIDHDMVNKHGVCFKKVFKKLCDLIKNQYIVIYNSKFDLGVLRQTCIKNNCDFNEFQPKAIFCAMQEYSDFWGEWNPDKESFKWQSLKKATAQQGISYDDAHRALNDCKLTLMLCNTTWGEQSLKKYICDDCNGSGQTYCEEYLNPFSCKSCDGTGEVTSP